MQAAHAVLYRRLGRDEDAGCAGGADIVQQVVAVDLGHHNIQQHQVVLFFLQQIGGFDAVGHGLAAVACVGQDAAYQHGDSLFVVYN